VSEYLAYRGDDLPGSRRAPCLGCGERVVTARDPHTWLAGMRDGSWLLLIDAAPLRSFATDPDRIFAMPDAELLGVAHRACSDLARRRVEDQEVESPAELPKLLIDDQVGDLPALHLPPAPGICAFCGSTDVSEEHVWPKWFSRALADHGGFVMPTPYGPRPKPSLEIKAPVCNLCNNRWLSVLETDVSPVLRPMVRGEERTLSPDEQRLLATWAVKTAFMLDLHTGIPVIPTGFYYDLRRRRSPLSSNVVWVGAYSGSRWAAWVSHTGLYLGITPDKPPNAFVTTFTAFRVVFQVFGHFTKGGASLNDSRALAGALAPIWPPTDRAVDWPLQRLAFNDTSLVRLASSITG
jgi:hypothetical protein